MALVITRIQRYSVPNSAVTSQTTINQTLAQAVDWDHAMVRVTYRGNPSSRPDRAFFRWWPTSSTNLRIERIGSAADLEWRFDIVIEEGNSDLITRYFQGSSLTTGTPQEHDISALGGTLGDQHWQPCGGYDSNTDARHDQHPVRYEMTDADTLEVSNYDDGGSNVLSGYSVCAVRLIGSSVQHVTQTVTTGTTFDITASAVTLANTISFWSAAYEGPSIFNSWLFGDLNPSDTTSWIGTRYTSNSDDVLVSGCIVEHAALTVDRVSWEVTGGAVTTDEAITDRSLAYRSVHMATAEDKPFSSQNDADDDDFEKQLFTHVLKRRDELKIERSFTGASGDARSTAEIISWPCGCEFKDDGYANSTTAAVSTTATVNSGSNRLLVAFCMSRGNSGDDDVISSVTFNSTAGTQLGAQSNDSDPASSNHSRQYIYYWLDTDLPSAGSYTLTATFNSEADDTAIQWMYLEDMKQSAPSPVDTSEQDNSTGIYASSDPVVMVGFSGNEEHAQVDVTADGAGVILGCWTGRNTTETGTAAPESGQTLLGQDDPGNTSLLGQFLVVDASGSQSMDVLYEDDEDASALGQRFSVCSLVAWEEAAPTPDDGVHLGYFAGSLPGI